MTVPAPQPEEKLSRFQAQVKLGLITGVDVTAAVLLLLSWITLGYWFIFGKPTIVNAIFVLLVDIMVFQTWLTLLAFRVMVFVLDLGAEINLMPQAAARIVAGYFEGRPK